MPAANRVPVEPGGPVETPTSGTTFLQRIVFWVSLINFAGVASLLVLLCLVSEEWWVSLAMTYLPRLPYLLPSALLTLAALLIRRRLVWLNLFSALLVLGPIMGFRLPLSSLVSGGNSEALTVASYNVQGGHSDVEAIIAEIQSAAPDVIVLQEASRGMKLLKARLHDWHIVHAGEYLVAARWPVELKDACRPEAFGRATAILCEVDAPHGPFLVCNVHLTTARYGLAQLRPDSLVSGSGVGPLKSRQELRDREAEQTRNFVKHADAQLPLLAVGDFNMPTTSSVFQTHWGDMTSAFDAAGLGYGYTSPCDTGRLWPENTPWLRIDHILLSRHWTARRCWIGGTDGSDHRCILARVRRR